MYLLPWVHRVLWGLTWLLLALAGCSHATVAPATTPPSTQRRLRFSLSGCEVVGCARGVLLGARDRRHTVVASGPGLGRTDGWSVRASDERVAAVAWLPLAPSTDDAVVAFELTPLGPGRTELELRNQRGELVDALPIEVSDAARLQLVVDGSARGAIELGEGGQASVEVRVLDGRGRALVAHYESARWSVDDGGIARLAPPGSDGEPARLDSEGVGATTLRVSVGTLSAELPVRVQR
jgi:hypothetical protein